MEWTYEEWDVRGPLARFVRCLWRMRGSSGSKHDLIPPDGHPEILFGLGDRTPLLVGHVATPAVATPSGPSDMFGVRLQPAALGVLFGHPAKLLTGAVHRLEEVCPLEDLARIQECAPGDRSGLVQTWLTRRLARSDADDRLARAAVQQLNHRTVNETARALGTTTRSLQRNFAEFVGVSPKAYFRTQRFRRALRILEGGGSMADAGEEYFDQAHFIRDFKAFTGVTPRRYLDQRAHSIEMSTQIGQGTASRDPPG